MANGFKRANPNAGILSPILKKYPGVASTTYSVGAGLIFDAGRVKPATSQTDKIVGVFNDKETKPSEIVPSSKVVTGSPSEDIKMIPRETNEFWTDLVSPDAVNIEAAGAANTLTTVAKVAGSGSNGDFDGGVVAANGEQRNIVTSTIAAGVWTFTVDKAFTIAPTTIHTIRAVYMNAGKVGVKLSSTAPSKGVSTALADLSSGYVDIIAVDLLSTVPRAKVRFQT